MSDVKNLWGFEAEDVPAMMAEWDARVEAGRADALAGRAPVADRDDWAYQQGYCNTRWPAPGRS